MSCARVTVPVLRSLTYQGRDYVRGDSLEAPPVEIAILARRGYVTLTVGAEVARDEPPPARRRYRRRDLTPEP